MKIETKKIIVTFLIIVSIFTIFFVSRIFINKKIDKLPEVRLKELDKNKNFAIMIPSNNDKGYIPYEGEMWPTDENDYFYSHAECMDNNGKKQEKAIIYNEENQTVELSTNQTLYCTLYFDKYNYMKVVKREFMLGIGSPDNQALASYPAYMSGKIKNVYFVNYIDTSKAVNQWDLSDTSQGTQPESVMAWTETIDENYENLYIGSKTKIRAIDLSQAFSAGEFITSDQNPITNLKEINFNNMLDTSKTVNMTYMFFQNNQLETINGLNTFDTSNVTYLIGLFYGCQKLSDISALSNWDVSKVQNMQDVFLHCYSLNNINPIANWNTENVISMNGLFLGCEKIEDVSILNNWNIKNLATTFYMFGSCTGLKTINLSNWNTSKFTETSLMFADCTNLQEIDMQNITFTQITDKTKSQNMFMNVPKTANLKIRADQKDWIRNMADFEGIVIEV